MRSLQVLLRKIVFGASCLGLHALALTAWAGSARVVVVGTEEPGAWAAAERRLIAEFAELGVDVVLLPGREGVVRELPQYAANYGAVAAVQVLRRGDNGVVRFWAPGAGDERGEFRHISVSLRNPDVVNLAVLPVREFVYERVEAMPDAEAWRLAQHAATRVDNAPAVQARTFPVPPDWATRLGAPVVGPPVRYHVRSQMRYAARVGGGPWFSGAGTTPAVNVVLGLRAHWFELFSFEAEAFMQPVPHRVEAVGGSGDLRMFGGRGHVLYEPWPNSDVSLGFGPGAGYFVVLPSFPYEVANSRSSGFMSFRTQLASPLMPYFDVVFTFEVNRAWVPIAGYSLTKPKEDLMRVGMDSMVAVDWHWQ